MQEDTPIGCALIRHWNKKDVQRVCTYMKTIDYDECKGDWFTMGNFQQYHALHNLFNCSLTMVREPRAEPLLVVDTTWTDSNTKQYVHVPTLIDTGCNTSLLHSSMLNKLLSCRGKNLYVHELSQTISLTAATGDCLSVRKACTTDFVFQGQVVSHCMFIVDSLACDQKLLLGMDFLKQNNVRIDMETNTVTLPPRHSRTYSLICTDTIFLQPKQTVTGMLTLTSTDSDTVHLPIGAVGYLYPHYHVQDGIVVWDGIQAVEQDGIRAWLTNTTDLDLEIDPQTFIAEWEMSEPERIHEADALAQEISYMVNALRLAQTQSKTLKEANTVQGEPQPVQVNNLTTSTKSKEVYNAEDYEWKEKHLYTDFTRVPIMRSDPPVDATLEDLQKAWADTWTDVTASRQSSYDQCSEVNSKLQQLLRLNDRMRMIIMAEEESQDLPPELDLEEGYEHFTPEQKMKLTNMLRSEASFFMKGKYPKIVRTNAPVVIDTGNAPPKVSGYQRLSQAEQEIVNKYVENLIAADVVEPCNSPWSSPILLVPKKDGSLRAVADLRAVNKCVLADSYAMPDTQHLINQLADSRLFSSLDLSSAFWQLPLAEKSRDCTAFMSKTHGLLRWKAMPMGFKNSSAYFQRAIDSALGGLRFTCCAVYIDDVITHNGGDFDDHLIKLKATLRALRTVGFPGNPRKCKFAQREVAKWQMGKCMHLKTK